MSPASPRKVLADLLPEVTGAAASVPVPGLVVDSRQLRPGELFLAFPGTAQDGRAFIAQAVSAGAGAVVAEAGAAIASLPVPLVQVENLRERVSDIADRFFDRPSADLAVIGVTGTNGKTSCSQLLGQALRIADQACGVIGTLGASLDGSTVSGGLTTPDPVALQAQLAEWRDKDIPYVAMEASSHGLAQGRVAAIRFRGAVFTNLSRDHLDFHGDMASYGAAKSRLFDAPGLGFAVLNADDAFGRELAARYRQRLPVMTYGAGNEADLRATDVGFDADGIRFRLHWAEQALDVRSRLLGDFNLSNLLAVAAVLIQLGYASQLARILPALRPITGRMERLAGGADIDVVIDYAHTPDALDQALQAARRHCRGKLWCVFGCGGDRDAGKRPLMGAVAERSADQVVLTNDNPRGEPPEAILADIRRGMARAARVVPDRGTAIAEVVLAAAPGDVVMLAGKGHEDYQIIDGQRRPFSDAAAARTALLRRAERLGAGGPQLRGNGNGSGEAHA